VRAPGRKCGSIQLHVEIPRLIARHERHHSRRQHALNLEHHLGELSHKPGAFAGSKPLAQWRATPDAAAAAAVLLAISIPRNTASWGAKTSGSSSRQQSAARAQMATRCYRRRRCLGLSPRFDSTP
jgi:hypothetical protein